MPRGNGRGTRKGNKRTSSSVIKLFMHSSTTSRSKTLLPVCEFFELKEWTACPFSVFHIHPKMHFMVPSVEQPRRNVLWTSFVIELLQWKLEPCEPTELHQWPLEPIELLQWPLEPIKLLPRPLEPIGSLQWPPEPIGSLQWPLELIGSLQWPLKPIGSLHWPL